MGTIDHYELQVDWDGDGSFAESEVIRDSDITGRIVLESGYKFRNSRHGRLAAGSITLDILDPDGIYDPTNDESPLHPNITPGRTILFSAIDNDAVRHPIWAGVLDNVIPILQSGRNRLTRLVGTGVFLRAQSGIVIVIQRDIRARDAALQILDQLNISTDIEASDSEDTLLGFFSAEERAATALERVGGSILGLFYENGLSASNEPIISLLTAEDIAASAEPTLHIELDSARNSGVAIGAERYTLEGSGRGIVNRVIVEARIGTVSTGTMAVVDRNVLISMGSNFRQLDVINNGDALWYLDDLEPGELQSSEWSVDLPDTFPIPALLEFQVWLAWQGVTIEPYVEPYRGWYLDYGARRAIPRITATSIDSDGRQVVTFVMWNPWSSTYLNQTKINNAGHENDPQEVLYGLEVNSRFWELASYLVIENDTDSQNQIGIFDETIMAFAENEDAADDLAEAWLTAYSGPQFVHSVTYDASNDSDLIAPSFDQRVRLYNRGEVLGDFAVRAARHSITQGRRCTITLTLVPATTYVAP